MTQTYDALWYHIVFATKDRDPALGATIIADLHAYLGGIARETGIHSRAIGGVEDHVHLLIGLPPDLAVADAVRVLKTDSSKWLNGHRNGLRFAWQNGYSAFTVSVSQLDTVERYIATQAEHHRTMGFGGELKRLLDRHGVAYKPEYLPT